MAGRIQKRKRHLLDEIRRAAAAFARNEDFDVDVDDPRLDEVLSANRSTIAAHVGDRPVASFYAKLRMRASTATRIEMGADGRPRHTLRRDLFLIPIVGTTYDAWNFVGSRRRMLEVSEIVRRTPGMANCEDVVLLPVLLDKRTIAKPAFAALRAAIRTISACLDADDVYDDDGMDGIASDAASLFGASPPDRSEPVEQSRTAMMHAILGLASSRLPVGDVVGDFEGVQDQDGSIANMLSDAAGDGLDLGAPQPWPAAAADLAVMAFEGATRTLLLREGLAPNSHISAIRCATSNDKIDVLMSAVSSGRVVGIFSLPTTVAFQHPERFMDGLRAIADRVEHPSASNIMAPASVLQAFAPGTSASRSKHGR